MEQAVQIDQLKYLYLESSDKIIPESEALKTNLTKVLWETIEMKLEHNELINIQLRGEVRTSKSTIACKLVQEINKLLEQRFKDKATERNMRECIFCDQTEFLRFINSEVFNVCIQIDEFNTMAATGANATTEEKLFDYYSDVFAGKYIHRVSCSPDTITDKNATIILDILGKDEETRTTRCKLIYRDIVTKTQMTLGYVDIYVGDIIDNWLTKVRPIFTKRNKTPQEERKIEYWKQKDWYVAYQVKKYRRMELLEKEGVRDIREPEYASIVLDTLIELQDLAKIKKVPFEIVTTVVDEVRRRNKRIYSMVASQEIAQKVRAILGIYTEIHNLTKVQAKSKNPEEAMIINKTIEQMKDMLQKRIDEQTKLKNIYREYVKIR